MVLLIVQSLDKRRGIEDQVNIDKNNKHYEHGEYTIDDYGEKQNKEVMEIK